jgi:hypothetical protein
MYGNASTAATTGSAAALPFTGLGLTWVIVGGFALLAAGFALRRIFPRRES